MLPPAAVWHYRGVMHTALILILGLTLVCGCAGTRETGNTKPKMRALGEDVAVDEGASDESIGREVRRRLELADPSTTAGVIIQVDQSVVTLRGVAPTLKAAWQAEAAARATPGVKEVINDVIVNDDRRTQ